MENTTQDTQYLTRRQAAEHCNVSGSTLDYWRKNHGLPVVKIGQIARFRRIDLDQFLEQSLTATSK